MFGACQRSNIDKVMRENYLPLPPDKGDDGYWVKRADTTAQSKEDVCFCHDWSEVEKIKSTLYAAWYHRCCDASTRKR